MLTTSVSILAASAATAQDVSIRPDANNAPAQPNALLVQASSVQAPVSDAIVVTARRRNERLIDVPVAVTAISQEDISRYNASDLQQIGQLAPQLVITSAPSGSGASLSIRGIGSVAEDPGVDQSIGVYIDNVGIGRGRIIGVSMFDIERVEVLKGPQALFFGKNSPAGVVSLTSAGPTGQFEGGVIAGYEFNAKERYVEAALGGPVSSTIGARIAVRGEAMDGFFKNVARPILDPLTGLTTPGAGDRYSPKKKQVAARLTLTWDPSPEFSLVGKFLAAHSESNDPTGQVEHYCLPDVTFSVAGVPDPSEDCKLNRVHVNTGVNPALAANWPNANGGELYGETDFLSASVIANLEMGALTLTSITAASRLDYSDLFNATQSSYEALIPQSNELTKSFSQELRLNSDLGGPIDFTTGVFYETNTRDTPNSVAMLFVGPDLRSGLPRHWSVTREADNKGSTISAFGQLRWKIADSLELAGGVRFTHDKKKISIGNSFVNPNVLAAFGPDFLLPEGQFLDGSYSDNDWSPEATLTWHPSENQTIYAAYKTGYKSGGFSNALLISNGFTIDNLTYNAEKTKGFEVGYKALAANNRLRFEAAFYRYNYSGLQLSAFEPATFSYFIRNAGAARTTGVEASAQYEATEQISFRVDAAYNDAKFLDYVGAPCYQTQTPADGCVNGVQNPAGKALPRAPKFTLSTGITLDFPLSSDLNLGIDGDMQYKSSYFIDQADSPLVKQDGFLLVNAAIRLRSDAGWVLSLIGRNLTNELYSNYATDSGLAPVGVYSVLVERGRQAAVQISYNF